MKPAAVVQYALGALLVAAYFASPYLGLETPDALLGLVGAWLSPSAVTAAKALREFAREHGTAP